MECGGLTPLWIDVPSPFGRGLTYLTQSPAERA
jgi:hypothetical protein